MWSFFVSPWYKLYWRYSMNWSEEIITFECQFTSCLIKCCFLCFSQNLAHEPAVIDLLRQQYNLDRNVRLLQSFMVCIVTLCYGKTDQSSHACDDWSLTLANMLISIRGNVKTRSAIDVKLYMVDCVGDYSEKAKFGQNPSARSRSAHE